MPESSGAAPTCAAPVVRRVPPPTPSWWRGACWCALVAALLAVVGLWAAEGGTGDLTGSAAAALTSAGRLLGLVASLLLLVQVLLVARVPLLERAVGQSRLVQVHRWVGFSSFTLLAAHVALVGQGYALSDGRDLLAELWVLTWTYPGMLLATAGTGLLVLVVATSLRAARRRLRYESWHLLHLYSYLGAGLVLPHQLWTGSALTASRTATVLWWAAWASTAAAVLAYRVGLPLLRTARHRLVVTEVVREAPGVVSLHLRGRDLDRLPVRAGQFFHWRFLDAPGRTRAHPYSLSAAPHPAVLRITVQDHGSAELDGVHPGTRVAVEGPYGRLTAERRTRRGVLLLACGLGVTPLRALAEELEQEPGDVVLLHRVRTDDDAVFREELSALAGWRGLHVVHLSGPRAAGRASFLPAAMGDAPDAEVLRRLVPDVAERDVYVCGPGEWVRAARSAVRAAGVPARRVHEESFAW